MADRFGWNGQKAASNATKHGVSFQLGSRVFADSRHITFDVTRAEDGEERRKAIGMVGGKLYCVVYTNARRCLLDHLRSADKFRRG